MVTLPNQELQKVLGSAEIRQRFAEQGGVPVGGAPQVYARFVQAIKAAGLKAE